MNDETDVGIPVEQRVSDAVAGDAEALDDVVLAIRDDIYGLSIRMLGHPADAEDATQEILIKVLTHLGDFRGEARFRTWYWTIAQRHLLRFRRSRIEQAATSFEALGAMGDAGLGAPPLRGVSETELPVLAEEVKLGCIEAMLCALDRDQRIAFLVHVVFGLPSAEAAEVLEIEPPALRKRVSRARRSLREFMAGRCGLFDADNACRCERQIAVNIQHDLIDPAHLVHMSHRATRPNRRVTPAQLAEIAEAERIGEIYRSSPEYAAPDRVMQSVRELLASDRFAFLS